jgi:hypothetical protein
MIAGRWYRTVLVLQWKILMGTFPCSLSRQGREKIQYIHIHQLHSSQHVACSWTHPSHTTTNDTILRASMPFCFFFSCVTIPSLPLLFILMFPETFYHMLLLRQRPQQVGFLEDMMQEKKREGKVLR